MSNEPVVIVGGGLAAGSAARTLRAQGYDGDLVVFTAEPHHPYERPPLTKDYLRGESGRGAAFAPADTWYHEHEVDVRTATAIDGLDVVGHRVVSADGREHTYSKLLLATGSAPKALGVEGADLRGVLTLRTVDNADLLAASLAEARRIRKGRLVVVGDGWIGMEVAASARALGLDVVVLGRGRVPLSRVLGEKIGGFYGELHREHGVDVRSGAAVSRFRGSDGIVRAVELADGSTIQADVVLVAVGASPNVGLARAAGIDLRSTAEGGGIAVDGTLTTSAPDVFAAGDVASIPSTRWNRSLRVEHWATAVRTGTHAAKSMLGSDVAYERLPYFYSDQFDTSMEYTGFVAGPDAIDDVVISGSPRSGPFAAFWVRDGHVHAGMNVNLPGAAKAIERLISVEEQVPVNVLHDFVGSVGQSDDS